MAGGSVGVGSGVGTSVGGSGVAVGGSGVAVGGTGVAGTFVGGTGVAGTFVGGTCVGSGATTGASVGFSGTEVGCVSMVGVGGIAAGSASPAAGSDETAVPVGEGVPPAITFRSCCSALTAPAAFRSALACSAGAVVAACAIDISATEARFRNSVSKPRSTSSLDVITAALAFSNAAPISAMACSSSSGSASGALASCWNSTTRRLASWMLCASFCSELSASDNCACSTIFLIGYSGAPGALRLEKPMLAKNSTNKATASAEKRCICGI